MPNVLFTQSCVRSCPYCFASEQMKESDPNDLLSWENLIYVSDFLKSSGERSISVLGGEPTLHPDFLEFIIYLLERDFVVRVFTSGIMANTKLDKITSALMNIPDEQLTFIVNLNNPSQTPSSLAETESVKRFLSMFGTKVMCGFNIYRVDFELDFLFQYINCFGLKKSIRLGIAHPIPGAKNIYININDIDHVIARLMNYVPFFERFRIRPSIDCGFPLCRFTDTQLGWFTRHTGSGAKFGCSPVFDIGPDLRIWSCFPLSSYYKRSLFEFDTIGDIYRFFKEKHRMIRSEVGGIYPECDECSLREDEVCSGGCVAHLLSIFKDEAPVRMPVVCQ